MKLCVLSLFVAALLGPFNGRGVKGHDHLRKSASLQDFTNPNGQTRRLGSTAEPPLVEKTATPQCVNQKDSGGVTADQVFTVNLKVTGAGGTSTNRRPVEIVFALDSSGSMSWNDPNGLRKTASKAFVDKLDSAKDRGGVVSWDDQIDFTTALTSNFGTLKTDIDKVNSSGDTNLNVGLNKAIDLLNASNDPVPLKVIIFLTDGVGAYTNEANNGPAKTAANKGYVIYSVALGSAATGPLQDMAGATGGTFTAAATADDLVAVFLGIFETIVSSSIPNGIIVEEITNANVADISNVNPTPASMTVLVDGRTKIVWELGTLSAQDAPKNLSFDAKYAVGGPELEVNDAAAKVTYKDSEGVAGPFVPIPGVKVNVNRQPDAKCKSASKNADESCEACFDKQDVNDGSSDPYTCQVGSLVLSLAPPAPTCFTGTGNHEVTLTATDGGGLTDSCTADVTVVDTTAPTLKCNSPATMVPSNAGTAFCFKATAADNCDGDLSPTVTSFDCWTINGAGKRINKKQSCVTSFSADTFCILDSGGVGDNIEWTIEIADADGNSSSATCAVKVLQPGNGGKKT